MDLIGDMLMKTLPGVAGPDVEAVQLRPRMIHRWTRLPVIGRSAGARLADRLTGRVWDYPRWLAPRVGDFDIFHVIDHSYAHVLRVLPADRTIVTCNDVDAIEAAVRGSVMRPAAFLARSVLSGVSRSAHVACISEATKAALLSSGRVRSERVSVAYLGVHPSCTPGPPHVGPDALLHVGSTVPRKRIDVLLQLFAGVRRVTQNVRLIRVGGALTGPQRALAAALGVLDAIDERPVLDRAQVAEAYREASLLLLPSDREGFGLPLVEAMACGTPVVGSAIPALQEIGGDAAVYCRPGDVAVWVETVKTLLQQRARDPEGWEARRAACLRHSARFNWNTYAAEMTKLYWRIATQRSPQSS